MPGLVLRMKGALSQTAAKYQITTMAKIRVRTGRALPSNALEIIRGRGSTISKVIGMTGAQSVADAMGDVQERLGVADVECAIGRKVAIDDVDDATRTRRHHDNAAGQKD